MDKIIDHLFNQIPKKYRTLAAVIVLICAVVIGFFLLNSSKSTGNIDIKNSNVNGSLINTGEININTPAIYKETGRDVQKIEQGYVTEIMYHSDPNTVRPSTLCSNVKSSQDIEDISIKNAGVTTNLRGQISGDKHFAATCLDNPDSYVHVDVTTNLEHVYIDSNLTTQVPSGF